MFARTAARNRWATATLSTVWVSNAARDLVPVQTVSGPITLDNAPPGAIGKMVSTLEAPAL